MLRGRSTSATQTRQPADRRQPARRTGSGSASACWRSAPASRCCRSARSRSRWRSCRPSAATTTRWRCCWRCCSAAHARRRSAQHVATPVDRADRRRATPLEQQLQHEIVCMCGALRPRADRRVPNVRHGLAADARRARGADRRRARTTTQIIAVRSSRSTAARRCSARRSTRASTASRGSFPYLLGAGGAVAVGFAAVRWSRNRDADARCRRPPPTIRRSTRASTMSSATSTERRRSKPAPATRRPIESLQPWQFFVLAGAGLRDGGHVHRRAARASRPSSC